MDCAHTRELLEQYVLGALEPEERSEVERHLESCAECRTTRERGPFARSYGKLYTRPDLSDVVAFANRLPEAPKGRAYHLWLTVGGRTKLAGVLTVRDGFGLVVFKAQRPGPKYGAAVLTLQKPGADAPAGTPVLTWRA